MDLRRLRAGEWVAALGGAALLVALFLSWYDGSVTGWEALGVVDVLLAAVAVFALVLLPITATQRAPALPLALDALVALAGMVALVLVLVRTASPPGEAEGLGVGIWLALAGSIAIVAGGWLAMRDERLAKPGEYTDVTGRPTPPPPEIKAHPNP